ncbi:STAS domain-containing protein [Streptomyces antibioticus]|uniref:STAS domain-containing protein n=1 Tax=Streptomyces antibioticus TaxID=1890 RepID=UPI003D732950
MTDSPLPCPAPGPRSLRVRPLPERAGWRAGGEITLASRPLWERTLHLLSVSPREVCRLELSAVTFVDLGGVSALAVTAQELPAGRRIVLDRPPAAMPRLLDMFWPGLQAIDVVAR